MRQGELLPFLEPGVNPYIIPRPALISFSGGRTSARMLKEIINAYEGSLPDDIIVAYCNTGKELEATLRFVQRCGNEWGVKIWWLEFDPTAEHMTKVVSFETASRNGEPLAAAIATRPTQHLPNPVSRYCSVTSKARRMHKLMHEILGFERWHAAIGLRADEGIRVIKARARGWRDRQLAICPLAEAGVTKLDVMDFWKAQSFDLELPNIDGVTPTGNCDLCMLKDEAKIVSILRVQPSSAVWWIRQEDRMTDSIKDTPRQDDSPERRDRFFKDGTSYRDLLAKAQHLNEIGAPMEDGYGTGTDCNCTD